MRTWRGLLLLALVLAGAAAAPSTTPFLQWLHRLGGGIAHAEIREGERGLGLHAIRDVRKGAVFARTPLAAMINVEHALTTPLVGEVAEPIPDADALAVLLAYERRQDDSPWGPYLDLLPAAPGLSVWSAEELNWLDASPWANEQLQWQLRMNESVRIVMDDIAHHITELEGQVSEEDLVWAHSMLRTRLHTLELRSPEGKWLKVSCMVPLADLLNFAPVEKANAVCGTNDVGSHFECVTTRSVAEGDELRVAYESFTTRTSAGELLTKYGFMPPADEATHALRLTPSREYLDMLGNRDRVRIAGEAGVGKSDFDSLFPFVATESELDIPETTSQNPLLRLFRVYMLTEDEIAVAGSVRFNDKTLVDQLRERVAVSVANEMRATDELLHMLRGTLEQYSTSAEEDEEMMPFVRDQGERTRGAVEVRAGEKRLLLKFIDNVKALQEELKAMGGSSLVMEPAPSAPSSSEEEDEDEL